MLVESWLVPVWDESLDQSANFMVNQTHEVKLKGLFLLLYLIKINQ